MSRIALTFALLLLVGLGNATAAEDGPKQTSGARKAEKVSTYLKSIGITHPMIHQFTHSVGNRVEGRNLRVTEHYFDHGRLVVHYKLKPKISSRQLELKFQPVNYPSSEFVATTKSAMVYYKWNF